MNCDQYFALQHLQSHLQIHKFIFTSDEPMMHLSSQHFMSLVPLSVLELLLLSVSVLGDHLLFSLENSILKAISDNTTHILIGVISWFIIIYNVKTSLSGNIKTSFGELVVSGAISSLIDIDHFILARSIHLKVRNTHNS